MADAPDTALVQRLARDNRRMGQRLAQLEYREALADLDNPALFDLSIDFGWPGRDTPDFWAHVHDGPQAGQLAPLDVPLGRIAWHQAPQKLPVIGIFVDGAPADWAAPLTGLFKSHHADPFARLLFVCRTLRPVPFLGRFGFACEHVGRRDPLEVIPRLVTRYGMQHMRGLVSGNKLWPL